MTYISMVSRMTKAQDIRWKAELEIIHELGEIPPSRKMQSLLKEKYGIEASHATINDDLKKDLEALTETEYINQKNKILDMTRVEMDEAHQIAQRAENDKLRLKAMEVGTRLKKTYSELLSIFRKTQAMLNKADKPIYNVYIGEPKETEVVKDGKSRTEEEEKSE